MGISVVLLAYKEEDNLRILLPQIINNIEQCDQDYEIVVVDTEKPTDYTAGVCAEYGIRYINQREPGFGGAFRTAIQSANKGKFLIMDSDCSHSPEYIPAIYQKFEEGDYDVVIGSRYVRGGKSEDEWTSILMSRILNFVFGISLGLDAKDLSTDYRMYHTKQLKQLSLQCRNYDVLQEVLLKLKLQKKSKKLSIGEVPIVFQKREYGTSKRKLLPFIGSYLKTLFWLIGIRIGYRA